MTASVFVNPKPKKHFFETTIKHWQLRDLIHCPERNHLYSVRGQTVNCYNCETGQLKTVASLRFDPTSITAKYDFLIAGGQHNQLYLKNLATGRDTTTSVGGSINNSLCIYKKNGNTQLLISNNDFTIKAYELPTLDHICDITFPAPVNSCAVSPDGKMMIAVGDCRQAEMFEVNDFRRVGSFQACVSAAFSCDWNNTSTKFAIACQDGFVSVWDARCYHTPLTTFSSEQPPDRGAIRNVKFSPSGPADLLSFTEHEKNVHIVDTRTLTHKQLLQTTNDSDYGLNIAGSCFSPENDSLYVALENCTYEYSIDVLLRRRFAKGDLN